MIVILDNNDVISYVLMIIRANLAVIGIGLAILIMVDVMYANNVLVCYNNIDLVTSYVTSSNTVCAAIKTLRIDKIGSQFDGFNSKTTELHNIQTISLLSNKLC